jgi:mono/diheme cytochrome c family protein
MKRIALFLLAAVAVVCWLGVVDSTAQAPPQDPVYVASVKPFFDKNCKACHNADNSIAGVRVDNLDPLFTDKQIRHWEAIRHRVEDGSMPPKGMPRPKPEERQAVVDFITKGLEVARLRPSPKNGIARRMTVAQYRNTLREVLGIEDELADILPPDAISADGFTNNNETLQLSPLLLEAYLEIAEKALDRVMIDPNKKPKVQNFRMDLGRGINKDPLPEKLVLGANSHLLENADFTVTQLKPLKPFAYEPFFMRTKYRFIEGYQGNDTVRGWREFDSIYHSVFACLRGSGGYPKGDPYNTVPEGLLLRPAIPNDELFEQDGTYGPKANFKISLRELPDTGRFRVSVMAAKYNDGLLLDATDTARAGAIPLVGKSVHIPVAGVYQLDAHLAPRPTPPAPAPASRLQQGLALEADLREGIDSPVGKAIVFNSPASFYTRKRTSAMNIGTSDFTVATWIHPKELRRTALVSFGALEYTKGWYLEMSDGRGNLRLETTGPDGMSNGGIKTPVPAIVVNSWQHVAAVVRRNGESKLYVNGYLVAEGKVGAADLDNPELGLELGHMKGGGRFAGEIADVRLFRRALDEAELQTLLQARGKQFQKAPPERAPELKVSLGGREFEGLIKQPAFVAVRLSAGPLAVSYELGPSLRKLERVTLTRLPDADPVVTRLAKFEKRSPRLGVYVGLRRDCGSTLAPVETPKSVSNATLRKFTFESEIANYPSPDVEKDNVNYLAGVREIGVRSEYTDGRDMPRLLIRSVEFEGPYYEQWPPASYKALFPASANSSKPDVYAREVLNQFAAKAWRRPVTTAELDSLVNVYAKARAAGRDFRAAMKDALAVVLTSPQFLFLIEKSGTPQPEPLDDYELSSKLSYFLWNGPPDATLQRLAATKQLRAQLTAQVDRMIAHPRFQGFLKEFGTQWLALDKFAVVEPDKKQFPLLTRDVKAHLKQEPVELLGHLIRNNRPAKELISADYIVANEVVANYYGLGDRTESGMNFVALVHGRRELGGLLPQAALMAGLSDGRESNPIKRGAWLARRIVAEPPADPPPNVPALKEAEEGLTLRQRLEMHRNQTGCFQCHTKIDPWGIALEEFDAGGRLKTHAADAKSKLPDGTEVNGIADFKRYLGEDRIDQVAFSVLKHLATYANGRTLTYNEINHLKQDGRKLKADGYRMKDLVRYVAASKIFLEK